MSLILRSTKGAELTHTEVDNNFLSRQALNTVGTDVGDSGSFYYFCDVQDKYTTSY